jgi:hypothetical protein
MLDVDFAMAAETASALETDLEFAVKRRSLI